MDLAEKVSRESQALKKLEDCYSTFGGTKEKNQVAEFQMEGSVIQVIEKADVNEFATELFNSINLGEYNAERLAQAVYILTTLTEEPMHRIDLINATASGIVRLTRGLNFNYITNEIRPYLFTKIKKNLRLMQSHGLIDVVGNKVTRGSFETYEVPLKIFGTQMYHPLGISSVRRSFIISEIAGAGQGIERNFLIQKMNNIRRLKIPKDAFDKTLQIHGAKGSGYILQRSSGGFEHSIESVNNWLLRLYERTETPFKEDPSGFFTRPESFDMINFITAVPAAPYEVLFHQFGESIRYLDAEVHNINYHHAQAIVVKRRDAYFTGQHIEALKLKNCILENNPLINLISDMYLQFSSRDAPKIAKLAKHVLHILFTDQEYKTPMGIDVECQLIRKILHFFHEREIIRPDENRKVYSVIDQGRVRWGSNIIGNILD